MASEVRSGLLVDWGGVLTTNLFASFGEFCREAGLAPDALVQAFRGDTPRIGRELVDGRQRSTRQHVAAGRSGPA